MTSKVYFSHYNAGHAEGVEYVFSMLSEVYLGHESTCRRTFLSAIVQSGISKLFIPSSLAEAFTDIPFLQSRLHHLPNELINNDYQLINDVFQNHLPPDYRKDRKYDEVSTLHVFLADLCTALRHNVALMFPRELPQPTSFVGLIPPELLIPISTLLDTAKRFSVSGPLPKQYLDKRAIGVFRDVIESMWFEDFCTSHEPLSDASTSFDFVIPQIREKAQSLYSNYDTQLQLSRIPTSILPIAPDIIDNSVGRFPGRMANHFLNLFQPYLENKRRLVIYDSSQIQTNIAFNTIIHIAENPDPKDIVENRLKKFLDKHPDIKAKIKDGKK